MNKIKNALSFPDLAEWALLPVAVCSGGFNEYISCAASVLIAALVIVRIIRSRQFSLRLNLGAAAVAAALLGYLVTCFYAVDRGAAFEGFLSFMPAALYAVLLMQTKRDPEQTSKAVEYLAVLLGAASLVLMLLPATAKHFTVAGRMAGFFGYPNSFALFLLVGLLCALSRKRIRLCDVIIAAALAVFIVLTGSRAVMLLGVAAAAVTLFFREGKKIKIIVGASAAGLIAAVLIAAPFLGQVEPFSRIFSFSFGESTLVGRLLYQRDALPLLLSHPFGMGYLGYSYVQQSVQTGVYSVRFIHNDIFQLALDAGWLPCLVFLAAIVRAVFRKGKRLGFRVIVAVILAHSLFDFDLQFTAVLMTLLLFMDMDAGKEIIFSKGRAVAAAAVAVCGIVSGYFAAALGLSYFGNYEASEAMYGANTENKLELLKKKKTIKEQKEAADGILAQNEYVTLACEANARYYYSEGDFEKVIVWKRKSVKTAPLSYEVYADYCDMLVKGIPLYLKSGDRESAEICVSELLSAADTVENLGDKLSDLGKMIDDQPKTELPKEISEYVEYLRAVKGK